MSTTRSWCVIVCICTYCSMEFKGICLQLSYMCAHVESQEETSLLPMFVFVIYLVDASLFLTLFYPSTTLRHSAPVAVCLSHLCQKSRNPRAGLLGLGVEVCFRASSVPCRLFH